MYSFFYSHPTVLVFIAFAIALVLTMAAMPLFIRILSVKQIGQQIRADGPKRHLKKAGTPTMGGIIILVMAGVSLLIIGHPAPSLILLMIATLLTGVLGIIDDATKVIFTRSLGLKPWQKIVGQFLISFGFSLVAVNVLGVKPIVTIPLLNFNMDFGVLAFTLPICGGIVVPWIYCIFVLLLMMGFSNAVNLTDGLDGLASGAMIIVMIVMAAISYTLNDIGPSLFAMAIAGGCLGFLWYNCHPADIFMGDTGSLALGTAFAGLAVVTKTEVLSLIIGALFVIEACSVIIQVVWFKRTRKRVFLMAPLHHHFEKKGWSETKVVVRFCIVCALFAGLGFANHFIGIW